MEGHSLARMNLRQYSSYKNEIFEHNSRGLNNLKNCKNALHTFKDINYSHGQAERIRRKCRIFK